MSEELIWQVWVDEDYMRNGIWALGHRYPQRDQMWFFIQRTTQIHARLIVPVLITIEAANDP